MSLVWAIVRKCLFLTSNFIVKDKKLGENLLFSQ